MHEQVRGSVNKIVHDEEQVESKERVTRPTSLNADTTTLPGDVSTNLSR